MARYIKMLFMGAIIKLMIFVPAQTSDSSYIKDGYKYPQLASQKYNVIATAYYSPLKGQKFYKCGSYKKDIRMNGNGIVTFTLKKVEVGHIAADPKVFPFGTVMEIPGYGIGVVEDIGEAIKGHKIDVYVGKGTKGLRKAIKWGVKKMEVEVIKWGE